MNSTGEAGDLRDLRGLVATCVGLGGVDEQYASAHEEMRAFNIQEGFVNVEYRRFPCTLVESGRDEVALHALREGYDWVLQIDGDAAPFPAASLIRLLERAFVDAPDADAVGAYCQLKQPPYRPTIDTGTGTWEEHYPGEGLLPVIRTGGHFLLQKTDAFRKMGPPPYHRTRIAPRAIEVMAELDNFARTHLDGRNPFSETAEWRELAEIARKDSGQGPSWVGEDSGFCDNLMAVGGKIYVDTDLWVGHVAKVVITPKMLKAAMDEERTRIRAACGVR
jgi:hypothetical protein